MIRMLVNGVVGLLFSVGYYGREDALDFSSQIRLSTRTSLLAVTDAVVCPTEGQAAIGGVIRDTHGRWIQGFSRYIGRCSVLVMEIWAVHDMLACAWRENIHQVILETDCLETCGFGMDNVEKWNDARTVNNFGGGGV
ncbi:hypothetical protein V6N12_018653 [Hibiscus sabdariffa]|uniref:RNase H type-1 domain-containing protein n=1 Tax=Hibiscus sabdariffa TaxID=183260 RepID=A0ABR1ZDZ6_9ROSI